MAEPDDKLIQDIPTPPTPQINIGGQGPSVDFNQTIENMPLPGQAAKDRKLKIWDGFTDAEIREKRTGVSGFYENALDDISNMAVGLGTLLKQSGKGALDLLKGKLSADDAVLGVNEFSEQAIKALGDSFMKWEDPGKALYNYPVESVLDLIGAMSILGSVSKTTASTFAKVGGKAPVGTKSARLLAQADDALDLGGQFKKAIKGEGSIDLDRLGDLLQNPVLFTKEAIAKPLRPALQSKVGQRVQEFVGVSKGARFIDDLFAKKAREINTKADDIAKRTLDPNLALKLTPDESKLAYFKSIGLAKLPTVADQLKDIAKQGGTRGASAQQLVNMADQIRKEYADIFAIERKLSPERRKVVEKAVSNVVDEITDRQEAALIRRGQLDPVQAKNSALSFLIAEADKAHGGNFTKAFGRLLGDEKLGRQQAIDGMLDVLRDVKVNPNYIPTEQIMRKSRIIQFLDKQEEKLFQQRSGGGDPNRFRQKEIRRFRELLDKKDKNTGLPLFNTDIDAALLNSAKQFVHLEAMSNTIDAIVKHPNVRRIRNVSELKPGDAPIMPGMMKSWLKNQRKAQELILNKLKNKGFDEFSGQNLQSVWSELSDEMMGLSLKQVEDLLDKKNVEVFAMPRDMAIAFQRHSSGLPAWLGPVSRVIGIWKAFVLLANPRWYLQTLIGNTILNLSSVNLFDYGKGLLTTLSRKSDRLVPKSINSDIISAFSKFERLQKIKRKTKLGRAVDHLTLQSTLAKAGDLGGGLANYIERLTRKTAFFSLANKRLKSLRKSGDSLANSVKTLEEALANPQLNAKIATKAIDDVDAALFDYNKMHPWERKYVRTIFPFWAWTRNIHLLVGKLIKSGLEKPVKSLALQRLSKIGYDMMNDSDQPRWMDGKMYVGGSLEDGGAIFFDTRVYNPFASVNTFALNPANINPFFKVIIEQVSGQNLYTQKPFRTNELVHFVNGRITRYNPESGMFTDKPFRPSIVTHIAKQFPQYNWINDLINNFVQTDEGNIFAPEPIRDIDGKPRFERERLFTLAKVFGFPIIRLEDEDVEKMRDRKLFTTESLVKKLRASLRYRPPEDHPIIIKAIEDLLEDKRSFLEFE